MERNERGDAIAGHRLGEARAELGQEPSVSASSAATRAVVNGEGAVGADRGDGRWSWRAARAGTASPVTALALRGTSIWRDRVCLDLFLFDDHYAAAA